MELDVEPAAAKRLVGKVMAAHMELRKIGDIVKLAYQSYLSSEMQASSENRDGCDLRNANGYEEMKSAGAVKNVEW
jgi:hypothetical protein